MSLSKKLQLKTALRVVGLPDGVDLGDVPVDDAAPAILGFVTLAADMVDVGEVMDVARADGIAWLAYPKAKRLGTDLNRDLLWQALPVEVRPVRQISIDDTWSALRLRPA